jgi:hypothetical protein
MDNTELKVDGFLKIFDPLSGEVFVDKHNAINFENFSRALALSIGNKGQQMIAEMHFGNGGTSVDPTGIITYLPPNSTGQNADLYNKTYYKIVDDNNSLNLDATHNNISIRHTPGLIYTDILISCLLDYGEPAGQQAFDNSTTMSGDFVFDELGLKGWGGTPSTGLLLTHVIFHPVQKSLNRLIQIDYTVRIQSLTNLGSIT